MLLRIIRYATTRIEQLHTRTNITKKPSEGDNMGDIASVTSVIQELNASVTAWNNLRYICVGATALFTLLSFLTFWVSGIKSNALNNAKDELTRLKDLDAKTEIAGLNTQAESLRAETEKAKEGVATAQAQAAKANADAATANQKAAEANRIAESERLARLKLETRVGTRVIDKIKFLAALKDKPKPQHVIIKRYAAAGDGWFVALQLDQLLREAGWPVVPGFDAPFNVIPSDQTFNVGPGVAPGGASSGIIVLCGYAIQRSLMALLRR